MPQAKADKGVFNFTGGLHTESSPLNYPENTALELDNVEINIDAVSSRRRALDFEQQRVDDGFPAPTAVPFMNDDTEDPAHSWVRWETAGDGKFYVVVQAGSRVEFYEDSSTTLYTNCVASLDLTPYAVNLNVQALAEEPLSWAPGDGRLFCTSSTCQTVEFKISDTTGFPIITRYINPQIREFRDIEDGIPVSETPTALTNSHEFNLFLRGWNSADITAFNGIGGLYPSKSSPWSAGWRRDASITTGSANINPDDWTNQWAAEKIIAAEYGSSSAAKGALLTDVYDQRYVAPNSSDISNVLLTIVNPPSGVPGTNVWTINVQTDKAHGLIVGNTVQVRNSATVEYLPIGGSTTTLHLIDGTYTVVNVPGAVNYEIQVQFPDTGYSAQFLETPGSTRPNPTLRPTTFDTAIQTDNRAKAAAFYAGRLFLSGIQHPRLIDKVYFSQSIVADQNVIRNYQDGDPTSATTNVLVASDGGYIQVPGMGLVVEMVPLENVLVLFAVNGVWQISGGEGFFAADDISVRKISDVGALSVSGIAKMDSSIAYTSRRGIYIIQPDERSGRLFSQSLIEQTIQSLWDNLPDTTQDFAQAVYDDVKKRIYFAYSEGTTYNWDKRKMLCFDMRLQCWFIWSWDAPDTTTSDVYEFGGLAITRASEFGNDNAKLKFMVRVYPSAPLNGIRSVWTRLDVMDIRQEDYEDRTSNTERIPVVETAYDNVGNWKYRRQAPYINVFSNKTETGFVDVGGQLEPVNDSSILMEARWDWADNATANKWSSPQQTYRHARQYIPTGASDPFETGEVVIVTKNKIRGRGRSLHLRFTGEEGKDFQLLGWSIQYAGTTRV